MANISFGVNVNPKAQEMGYDMYQTSLGEALGAIGKDAWNFNPTSSILRYYELQDTKSKNLNEPYIQPEELNKKYADEGLFFYEPEQQSSVDIILERKRAERKRQSIIERGPNDFLSGAAKLGTSFVASMFDPINIVAAFIPVVGQTRFAGMVARHGFTKARFYKGLREGFVGATAVEPIVYSVAQSEQADYDMMDSFLAVGFGTVLGGGLHVGAGKLKDFNTRRKFEAKIKDARKNLKVEDAEQAELNLYKEYYPESSDVMKGLARTDPETRNILLSKAMEDIAMGRKVDVTDVAKSDPILRKSLENEKVSTDKKVDVSKPDNDVKIKNNEVTREKVGKDDLEQEVDYYNSQKVNEASERDLDLDLENVKSQLAPLREKGKNLGLDDIEGEPVAKEVEELNTKSKEIKDAIIDGINCFNGK
jgi:hypothetical protein